MIEKANDQLRELSNQLINERKRLGYSQEDVANHIGVSKSTYARYEKEGFVNTSFNDLLESAEFLGIDLVNVIETHVFYDDLSAISAFTSYVYEFQRTGSGHTIVYKRSLPLGNNEVVNIPDKEIEQIIDEIKLYIDYLFHRHGFR